MTENDPDLGESLTFRGAVSETNAALISGSDSSDTSDAIDESPSLLAGLRNGRWLDAQVFPPLQWAVPGLLPEGFSLVVAPPKAGKSWLVLGWMLALASGGTALGHINIREPQDVLYLALEDGHRRMQSRARLLLGDHGDPIPERFRYITQIAPGSVVSLLKEYLRLFPATRLIVLDTLGKVMPPAAPGESAYARDYRVGGALKQIADSCPGLAILAVHHDRKAGSEDFVDSVSGTHGLAGAADAVLALQRARQSKDGILRVTGRDVPEESYALELTGIGLWQLNGIDLAEAASRAHEHVDEGRLSDTSTEVLAFIRQAGSAGLRAKDVRDKFGANADKYLQRRVADGTLIKPRYGHYVAADVYASGPSEVSESQVRTLFNSDTPTPALSEESES